MIHIKIRQWKHTQYVVLRMESNVSLNASIYSKQIATW